MQQEPMTPAEQRALEKRVVEIERKLDRVLTLLEASRLSVALLKGLITFGLTIAGLYAAMRGLPK